MMQDNQMWQIKHFYLDQFGLDLPVRGKLLMSKHILLAFRQSLLAGGRHLDCIWYDWLQHSV